MSDFDRSFEQEIIKAITLVAEAALGLHQAGFKRWKRPLRDAVFRWWETAELQVYDVRRYHSLASRCEGVGAKRRLDHAIPLGIVFDRLVDADNLGVAVKKMLQEEIITVVLLKEEDDKISRSGLRSKMPNDWVWGDDPFARYKSVNILISPHT